MITVQVPVQQVRHGVAYVELTRDEEERVQKLEDQRPSGWIGRINAVMHEAAERHVHGTGEVAWATPGPSTEVGTQYAWTRS